MAEHNLLGKEGEKRAAEYLSGKSYAILEKNWRYRKTELDIIASIGHLLVIVEVKTRTLWEPGEAEKSVTRAKQRRIVAAANAYMNERNLDNEVRFDVLVITRDGESYQLNHIPDAFYPLA